MRLRIQTFANNEVRISRQSDLAQPPLRGDTAKEKCVTKYATALAQYQSAEKALKLLLENHPHIETVVSSSAIQLNLFSAGDVVKRQISDVTTLPQTYKSVQLSPEGRLCIKDTPTQHLLNQRDRALDIISKSQERLKKHSTYGEKQSPKVFSKLARHRLLEAGSVVDRLGLKDSSSLLTLTLPGGTPEAKDALARWSGWIVNRQTQVLRDDKRFKGCYWFFVWEWQSRGALHQHWCVSADTYELAQEASLKMKNVWYKCLDEIGELESIDMYLKEGRSKSWKSEPDKWVWNEQKVLKDVGRYFAKYASKEVAYSEKAKLCSKRKVYFPSRWFGSSSSIKKACKFYRLDFSFHRINPIEAEALRHQLLVELYEAGITKEYKYDFEATGPEGSTVFCYGTTEILYVNPLKFDGVISSFRRQFERCRDSVFKSAPIQWSLHLARQIATPDVLGSLPFDDNYGRHVLYR